MSEQQGIGEDHHEDGNDRCDPELRRAIVDVLDIFLAGRCSCRARYLHTGSFARRTVALAGTRGGCAGCRNGRGRGRRLFVALVFPLVVGDALLPLVFFFVFFELLVVAELRGSRLLIGLNDVIVRRNLARHAQNSLLKSLSRISRRIVSRNRATFA